MIKTRQKKLEYKPIISSQKLARNIIEHGYGENGEKSQSGDEK